MSIPPAAATISTLTDPADPGTGNGIDVSTVGGLLAVAFDEPVTRWLVPEPDRRRQVLTDLFTPPGRRRLGRRRLGRRPHPLRRPTRRNGHLVQPRL